MNLKNTDERVDHIFYSDAPFYHVRAVCIERNIRRNSLLVRRPDRGPGMERAPGIQYYFYYRRPDGDFFVSRNGEKFHATITTRATGATNKTNVKNKFLTEAENGD